MQNKAKVVIDIDARLSNMSNLVKEFKQSTSALQIDKESLERIQVIENKIRSIRENLSKEISTSSGFTKYFSELQSIMTATDNLEKSLAGGFDKILSEKEIKLINDATAAIQNKTKQIEAQEQAEKKLAEATAARQKAEADLEKAKNSNKAADLAIKRNKAAEAVESEKGQLKKYSARRSELTADSKKASVKNDAKAYAKNQSDLAKVQQQIDETNARIDKSKAKIEEYKQQLKDLGFNKTHPNTEKIDLRSLSGSVRSSKNLEEQAKTELDTANQQQITQRFEELRSQAEKLGNIDLSKYTDPAQFDELAAAVKQSTTSLKDSVQVQDQAKNKLSELREETKNTKQAVDDSKASFDKQNKALGEVNGLTKRIEYFFTLSNAIHLAKSAINQATKTIKQLDAAMTETAIVTNFSVGDMWEKLPEYTQQANELGVSIKSLYESTTLYYQQGLKTDQAMALSVETMKMARIAGLDATEATDRMTNALRAFNMELDQSSAQRVNDVYSKVAAISASNVDELSTAMTKVASLAANVGMSFEQTTAYLATGIETTRESADSIGTALKTVLARFAEMKKDPTMQESVDGEMVDVNKVETALKSVGIALRDSNGEFRSMGDVFEEVNKKWDSLTNAQQRYIATMAAGSRQQSRFIAMMSDSARTTELYTAAMNSAGASQQQYSKTLESLQTKLQKLQNAWDTFLMSLTNSDIVKGVVDILAGFLNVFNGLESHIGGIGKFVVSIGSLFGLFKGGKALVGSMNTKFLKSLGVEFKEVTKEASGFSKIWKLVTKGMTGTELNEGKNSPSKIVKSLKVFAGVEDAYKLGDLKDGQRLRFLDPKLLIKVGVKLAGIAALIATIVALVKKVQKYTLAGKLKATSEAVTNLTTKVTDLQSSVNSLSSASDTLTDYQTKLNTLTKGSTEWNQALAENNALVLELAQNCSAVQLQVQENGSLGIANLEEAIAAQQEQLNSTIAAQSVAQIRMSNLNRQQIEKDTKTAYRKLTGDEKSSTMKAEYNRIIRAYKTDGIDKETFTELTLEEQSILEDMRSQLEEQNQIMRNQYKIMAQAYIQNTEGSEDLTASQLGVANLLGSATINDTSYKNAAEEAAVNTGLADGVVTGLTAVAAIVGLAGSIIAAVPTGGLSLLAAAGALGTAGLAGGGTYLLTNQFAGYNTQQDYEDKITELGLSNTVKTKQNFWGNLTFTIDGKEATEEEVRDTLIQKQLEKDVEAANQSIVEYAKGLTDSEANIFTKTLSGEKNDLLYSMANSGDASTFTEYFGFDSVVEFTNSLNMAGDAAVAFGTMLEETIASERLRQKEAKYSAVKTAMDYGISDNVVSQISILDAKSVDNLNSGVEIALSNGVEAVQSFYSLISKDFSTLTNSDYAEFTTWLSKQDFSNPITGLEKLNRAQKNSNVLIQEYAKTYKEIGSTKFSNTAQINYLLDSSNYADLNKEFDKLYKKIHRIDGSNIVDLAQSYEELSITLEQTGLTAGQFAEMLTSLYNSELELTDVTDNLIHTISKYSTATTHLTDLHAAITSFEDTLNSFEGTEYFSGKIGEIGEELSKGIINSYELKQNLSRFFDEDTIKKAFTGTNQEIKDSVKNLYTQLRKSNDEYGKDFWKSLTTKNGAIEGINAQLSSTGDIIFTNLKMTYDEFSTAIQKANNWTKAYTDSKITELLATSPELENLLNENAYQKAMNDLANKSVGGVVTLLQSEVDSLSKLYNKTTNDITSDIKYYTDRFGRTLRVVDWSNLNSANAASKISYGVEAGSLQTALRQNAQGKGFYDIDEVRKLAETWGMDESQIELYINELIKQGATFAKQTEVYDYNSDTGEYTLNKDYVTGSDLDDIEHQAKTYTDSHTIQNDKLMITNAIDDSTLVKGIAGNVDAIAGQYDDYNKSDKAKIDAEIESKVSAVTLSEDIKNQLYAKAKKDILTSASVSRASANDIERAINTRYETYVTEELVRLKESVRKSATDYWYTSDGDKIFDSYYEGLTLREQASKKNDKDKVRDDDVLGTGYGLSINISADDDTAQIDESKLGNVNVSTNTPLVEDDVNSQVKVKNYYNWLINNLEKVNELERERANIQAGLQLAQKYYLLDQESALAYSQANVENIRAMLAENQTLYEGSLKQAKELYALGKQKQTISYTDSTGKSGKLLTIDDLTQYGKIVNGAWVEDTTKVKSMMQNKDYGDEWYSVFTEWRDSVTGKLDEAYDYYTKVMDEALQYYETMTAGENAFSSLISEISAAIQEEDQKVIDTLNKTNDAINKLNSDIIKAMQDNINALRQDAKNAKEEDNLATLQRRIAYLQQDTTGANQREILSLQKQLNENTESYRDSLIDQAIQDLENANAVAEEQRQAQIDLLEKQLQYNEENGQYHKEAEQKIIKCFNDGDNTLSVDDTDALMAVMKNSDSWKGLTDSERGLKQKEIYEQLGSLGTWASSNGMSFSDLTDLVKDVNKYLEQIANGASGETTETVDLETLSKNWKKAESKSYANQNSEDAKTVGKHSDATGEYYTTEVGKYAANGWFTDNEGNWRYADANGYILQNGNVDGYTIRNGVYVASAAVTSGPGMISSQTGKSVSVSSTKKATTAKTEKEEVDQATVAQGQARAKGWYYNNGSSILKQTNKEDFAKDIAANDLGGYWYHPGTASGEYSKEDYYVNGWACIENSISPKGYYLFDSSGYLQQYLSVNDWKKLYTFKTGGLADFTGPAWLDGTKSSPELILNAEDTANFIALRDILSELKSSGALTNANGGGTYVFDVDINVDKLESDYDTQRVSNQVKQEITSAMTYRNVTSVSTLR